MIMSDNDIRPMLEDWPYRPGKISVRRVTGEDGRQKIQMRLDLGLIQMDTTGRPDGVRPEGFESLLEYFDNALLQYKADHGSDLGFELDEDDCAGLREEALMYYHRYLSCFILEEYDNVIRDTQRNIDVFDMCKKYAAKKADRKSLEQYRPYVIMMNTRAKAHLCASGKNYIQALNIVKAGLKTIRKFYVDVDRRDEYKHSLETSILKRLGRKIKRKLPTDPKKVLEKSLRLAIEEERFEEAADIQKQLDKLDNPPADENNTRT